MGNINLKKIIDLDKWQKLQDSLSLVTKMAILTVDYKGNPVSKHSSCKDFCTAVRNDSKLSIHCQKCDSRGGLEAVRINKPYIYLCHYNIVDIAIPIIIDDKYIGAIMAGQVKLDNVSEENALEKIFSLPYNEKINKEFNELYSNLPCLSYDEVKNIAKMLYELCNYIVEEALEKNLITQMYENTTTLDLSSYNTTNIRTIKDELSHAITSSYLTNSCNKEFLTKSILRPAIEYIYNNKHENVSLNTASDLCHISPSYFSRTFAKEVGQNYSHYISQLKIEWAKELLEKTDMPISEISDSLGFSEAGYFIKTFKKLEGITPLLYRKYLKK